MKKNDYTRIVRRIEHEGFLCIDNRIKPNTNNYDEFMDASEAGASGAGANAVGPATKLGPKQLADIEDELCNKPVLTLIGLNALCICHNVSIFYVDKRKYYDLNILAQEKKGTIVNRSLKYDLDDAFVRENYLHIENINKPIKAISGYTIKELQAMCKKLDIAITDENGKNKLKNNLYQDILTVI